MGYLVTINDEIYFTYMFDAFQKAHLPGLEERRVFLYLFQTLHGKKVVDFCLCQGK